jgi:hypothetical protein
MDLGAIWDACAVVLWGGQWETTVWRVCVLIALMAWLAPKAVVRVRARSTQVKPAPPVEAMPYDPSKTQPMKEN